MKRTYSFLAVFLMALCLPYMFFYTFGSIRSFGKGLTPTSYKVRSHNHSTASRASTTSTTTVLTTTLPFTCNPEVNVAYIKTHKTASTTLQTIFNRFGFFKNLSFIVNKRSPYNGHFNYLVLNFNSAIDYFLPPIGVRTGDYKNYKDYNMIAVHVRYYRDALEKFMANGTRYVTIIREPSAQWESAFNHFEFRRAISKEAGKKKILRINSTFSVPFNENTSSVDAILEFLRRPEYYHQKLKSVRFQNTPNLLWHYARNNQMFDLGLPTELHRNETLVNKTIDRLTQEMDLVIINEYFDESLIVMKKMLCWSFRDILYMSKNQRPVRSTLTDETRTTIREWNRADVLLYNRFNKTLWERIHDYGPRFHKDLLKFRQLLNETHQNCSGDAKIFPWGHSFKHVEFVPKANSSLFCRTIAESKAALFARIFKRQKPLMKPRAIRKRVIKLRKKVKKPVIPLPSVPRKPKTMPKDKTNEVLSDMTVKTSKASLHFQSVTVKAERPYVKEQSNMSSKGEY